MGLRHCELRGRRRCGPGHLHLACGARAGRASRPSARAVARPAWRRGPGLKSAAEAATEAAERSKYNVMFMKLLFLQAPGIAVVAVGLFVAFLGQSGSYSRKLTVFAPAESFHDISCAALDVED